MNLTNGVSAVFGEVAEWSKAPVLKTGVRLRVPWVRIPLHPLLFRWYPFLQDGVAVGHVIEIQHPLIEPLCMEREIDSSEPFSCCGKPTLCSGWGVCD